MAIVFSPTEIMAALGNEIVEQSDIVAEQFIRGVVPRSPVDTGLFRGNWKTTFRNRTNRVGPANKDSGAVVSREISKIRSSRARGVFSKVIVQNPVPYAEILNARGARGVSAGFVDAEMASAVRHRANSRKSLPAARRRRRLR